LQIARGVGWRSGESFANAILADCYISIGDYEAALACGQASLDIAQEIGHAEWAVTAHYCLGRAYADLLARPQAIRHLEEALTSARKIGSTHWLLAVGAELALAYVAEGDLRRAGQVLDSVMADDAPLKAVGQRTCWVARAELALAQSRPERALDISDRLISTAHNLSEEHIAPRLLKLRGDALAMLGDVTRAEADLLRAVSAAQEQGLPPLRWRLDLSLANLYRAQGSRTNASERYALARSVAESLAAGIRDGELKEGFLRELDTLVPRPRPISPARAAKEAFGGLTAREREVAALVSQGHTNRQIGERLNITEETAAVHVKNILSKLNFTSRAQIAAWAAEHFL